MSLYLFGHNLRPLTILNPRLKSYHCNNTSNLLISAQKILEIFCANTLKTKEKNDVTRKNMEINYKRHVI